MKDVKIRNFPSAYLKSDWELVSVSVIPGRELFMYRQDEGLNLVIDGRKIYFDDPYITKFYYFSSILGLQEVRIPNKENTRHLIKKFERDMDDDRKNVESIVMNTSESDRVKILRKLSDLDRYYYLIYYEELLV
jgi:hypothetical protein